MKRIVAVVLVVLMIGVAVVGSTGCGGVKLTNYKYEFEELPVSVEIGMPEGYSCVHEIPEAISPNWSFEPNNGYGEIKFKYAISLNVADGVTENTMDKPFDDYLDDDIYATKNSKTKQIKINGREALVMINEDTDAGGRPNGQLEYLCYIPLDGSVFDFRTWGHSLPNDDDNAKETVMAVIKSMRFEVKW